MHILPIVATTERFRALGFSADKQYLLLRNIDLDTVFFLAFSVHKFHINHRTDALIFSGRTSASIAIDPINHKCTQIQPVPNQPLRNSQQYAAFYHEVTSFRQVLRLSCRGVVV